MENRREVPEAAVFDILLFLPVVSLLRFKSVCKTWCSMIESSTFVTGHLYHNREKNNVVCAREGGELYMFSGNRHEMMGSKLNVESLLWEQGKKDFRIRMVNSCDGIVCLDQDMGKGVRLVSLWNPATKQVRRLPEPTYISPFVQRQNMFALGFDRKTRDYKIVRIILEHMGRLYYERHRNSVVEVYSQRSNAWRTIHEGKDFPITWIEEDHNAVSNNEICVWIGRAPSSRVSARRGERFGERSIFYFDLGNEVYGIVPAPDSLLEYPGDTDVLAFVSEKISLVKCNRCPGTRKYSSITRFSRDGTSPPITSSFGSLDCTPNSFVYEIWVMDEFGKKESWNKVYRVEETLLSLERIGIVSSLLKNGQFIVRSKRDQSGHERGVYLLDLVTLQEFLLLHLDNDDMFYMLRQRDVINYTESLVSVNGID